MKRTKNRVRKHRSKTIPVPQTETRQSGSGGRDDARTPVLALFPESDGGLSENAFIFDAGEYAALKQAAAAAGSDVTMFIANAALEKAAAMTSAAPQSQPSQVRAGERVRRTTFRVLIEDPDEVVEVRLDECQSEDLRRIAATSRLGLKALFDFIFFRQMESFIPVGEPCFRVWGDASRGIEDELRGSYCGISAVEAIAASIMSELRKREASATQDDQKLNARLAAWTELINSISRDLRLSIAGATTIWETSIVPALLERIPEPRIPHRPSEQVRAA
jgi:hypothetical protein